MNAEDTVQSVLDYHRKTNHSVESVRAGNISLDFSILPRLYKLYRRAETVPLPEESAPSNVPALEAIAGVAPTRDGAPTLEDVAALLKLSAGITKWLKVPNGSMAFRAASCTGALYHIELYLVCGDLPGLPAGVYQYGAQDNALRRVREGDYRGALVAATAEDPEVASAPVSVVYTSVFWRNAWKYQSRAYRHAYWDCGTVLANTLSVASSRGLPTQVVTGFADNAVNRVLDVDGVREAAVAIVPVGSGGTPVAPTPSPERVNLETLPYSPKEIDYPLIRATHAATSLDDTGAAGWRSLEGSAPVSSSAPIPADATESIEQVILRRGSTRQFQLAPIDADALRSMLAAAMRPVPGDWPPLNDLYLIVNDVDGLAPGGYVYHAEGGELEMLHSGDHRFMAGHLGLNQALAHDAAVNCYFLADLDAVTAAMGARGYRAAQLDASIRAGRLYLSAYSMGLGATGLTFFDDEVTQFFSPHAAGKSVMFLTLLGVPQKRRRVMPE